MDESYSRFSWNRFIDGESRFIKNKFVFKFYLSFLLICVATYGHLNPSDSIGNGIAAFILLLLWSSPIGILSLSLYLLIQQNFKLHYVTSNILWFSITFVFACFQFNYFERKSEKLSRYRNVISNICFVLCSILILLRTYSVLKLYFKYGW
jgi:hypothetical protein